MAKTIRQGVNSGTQFNPQSSYVIVNEPTTAQMGTDTIFYYGFVAWDGGWYLQKRDTTTGTNYFCCGDSNYGTAWTNRVSQSWERFDEATD